MFIVTLPLVLFMGPLNDHRRSFLQAVFALFGIANIGAYWFAGNYFEPNPNPYIHTWSLSVEEQVYLVLPWLIGFYYIRFKRAPHRILIVLSLASGSLFLFPSLMSTMYRMLGFESINTISFYSTLNRFWEFGLGAIISISPRQKWLQSLKKIRIPFVLLLIAMVFGSFTIEPRAQVVAIALLTAVVIDSNLELKTRAIALLEKIGDASYSIYLLHMPLLYLLRYSPLFVSQPAWRLEALAFLGLLTSVVVGFIFHAKIEEKYLLKLSRKHR
jgi:peptidoglycan/LPS O-acetylase OafA/YrhL